MGPSEALQVSPTLGLEECQVSPTLGPLQAPSFTYFRPLASSRPHLFWAPWQRSRFHLLWASSRVPGFTNCGPLASARFHLHFRPFASCRLHVFCAPCKRSRFHLLWASSRVPGFTNFGPLASARFHLLWAPRKLQVSPTLGPSQAAGFTSFGPLGSALGFTYFGPPQECQVSPTSGPSRVPGFAYFGRLQSRSLVWALSRGASHDYGEPPTVSSPKARQFRLCSAGLLSRKGKPARDACLHDVSRATHELSHSADLSSQAPFAAPGFPRALCHGPLRSMRWRPTRSRTRQGKHKAGKVPVRLHCQNLNLRPVRLVQQ